MSYLKQLYEVFQRSMPGDTVLVTNSRAAGRRILAAVAECGGPLIGVRAETPLSLAAELCAGRLSEPEAPRLMDEDEAAELMAECMRSSAGVFGERTAASSEAVREVCRTIRELELERAGALPTHDEKLTGLQALRRKYAEAKAKRDLWDRFDLLAYAAKQSHEHAGESRCVTLPSVSLTALERELLDGLSEGGLTVLPIEVPQDVPPPRKAAGDGRPADPFSALDGRVRAVACLDANVEAHFVFRDILEKKYPFDTCAVAYPQGTFALRLYEAAGRYGVPLSMAEGVPIGETALYAALRMLAEWRDSFFDAEQLRALLLNRRCLHGGHPRILARALRDYGVGWGSEAHYLDFVKRYRENTWNGTKQENQTEERAAELDKLCSGWSEWLGQIFTVAAPEDASLDEQKAALMGFLNRCDKIDPRERAASATALAALERIENLARGERLIDRLLVRLERKSVMSANACPGALLCLPLAQALTACREHLYVVGMGRDVFAPGVESAVLLDEERRVLMEKAGVRLSLSCEGGEEKLFRMEELLLHHEGDLVLSYAAFDSDRQMDLLPARVVEQIRRSAGIAQEIVSYIQSAPIDAGDVMLREEATELTPTPPYTADGAGGGAKLAPEIRFDQVISDYVFSASGMEDALRCPLSFYLKHLLHAGRDNPPEWRMNEWLPKNVMGTFCHKVLERYYAEGAQGLDAVQREGLLRHLFAEEWERVKRENPPSSGYLVASDEKRARDMIRGAIHWTEEERRVVKATERDFGLSDSKDAAVKLTAGRESFLLCGSIDRVDQKPDGSYGIVDYKTGDPMRLERERDYHLQHYLYKKAEKALSDGGYDPQDAGYLLLAQRTRYLAAGEDSDENAEALIEALLGELKAEEANALKAFPYRVEGGERKPWTGGEKEQKKAASCVRYCRYRELCGLAEK